MNSKPAESAGLPSRGRKTQPEGIYLAALPYAKTRKGFPLCPNLCVCTRPLLIDEGERCLLCGRTTRLGHYADCPNCRREEG